MTVRHPKMRGEGISASDSITVTGDWVFSGTLTIPEASVTDHVGAIDHDALLNFEQDEHFTQSDISITVSQISDFSSGGGLQNIVEDLTPELGGDLDGLGLKIENISSLFIKESPGNPDGSQVGQGQYWNKADRSGEPWFTTGLGQDSELARNAFTETITADWTHEASLIMGDEEIIKWLDDSNVERDLLTLRSISAAGTAIGHIVVKITTGIETTSSAFSDVTGATVPYASMDANTDYVVLVRAYVGNATSTTTAGNRIQLTKDDSLVPGSLHQYESPSAVKDQYGMMYVWGGVINSGASGDLQVEHANANDSDTVFTNNVTILMVKVDDLVLDTNVFHDTNTGVVEIDDGSFPSAWKDMGVSVTLGDGESDYLVFGSIQIDDFLSGANVVNTRVSDGSNTQAGGTVGRGDSSDVLSLGHIQLWQAPAANTTLTLEARTSGFPVDRTYGGIVAIRVSAFLDYTSDFVALTGDMGTGPTTIGTVEFTTSAAGDYGFIAGANGPVNATLGVADFIQNDLNGAGDVTIAGSETQQGHVNVVVGTDHLPHVNVSEDQALSAGDTVNADYIGADADTPTEWENAFIIGFQWSISNSGEKFDVGNPLYTTRLLGSEQQIRNQIPITWLNSDGNPLTLAVLGAGVTGDDDLGSVVLLTDVETNDGDGDQAILTDIGSHTLTATEASGGVADVSNDTAKYGTFSLFCDDQAGAVSARWGTTVNSTDFDFGSGDFTMECHLNFSRLSSTDIPIFAKWLYVHRGFLWTFNSTSEKFVFTWSTTGTTTKGGNQNAWPVGVTIATDTWYHVACSKSGNTVRFFVEGQECALTEDMTGDTIHAGTQQFEVFSSDNNGAGDHASYMDNLRITKGVARYTADFTPPTVAFPTTGNVVAGYTLGDPSVNMQLDANEIQVRGANTDNYLAIDHDDTDINIVGVNTTDINITSITAINAGTVDADFADLTATSFGGIDEANLLDKTAVEDVSAAWTFSGNAITISGTTPRQWIYETDGPADEKYWRIIASAGLFSFQTFNDALDTSDTIFSVARTGEAVDNIAFAVPLTATSYGGITEANLVDKSANETISGNWTIENAAPNFNFYDTNVDADEGRYRFLLAGGQFKVQTRTDADGAGADVLVIDRTGTTVDSIAFTGATSITGALTATSFGGITSANLVDKAATETIAAAWAFDGGITRSGNFLLEGYDGQRNIIRAERLRIQPGATPGTNINVTPNNSDSAAFNNQGMTLATDLAVSGVSGDFSLSANGRVLTLELGNVIGVVSAVIQIGDINSSSSTETYYADVAASGSDVLLQFYLQGTSASVDITTIMDAGDLLDVLIFYVTNT